MTTIRIFLASSAELKSDREQFEIMINRRNKAWKNKDVFFELVTWEDFLDAMSRTRLQDEYNAAIRDCDIFVMLFHTKVGPYTDEEFDAAHRQFQASGRPLLYIYFKDVAISTGSADRSALTSLWAFQDKLNALGHFQTAYGNVDKLQGHFSEQLDKLSEKGFIALDRPRKDIDSVSPMTQVLIDTGGGAYVGGRVQTGGGDFIGRDFIQYVTQITRASDDAKEVESVIALYLRALASDLAGLRLGEIDTVTDPSKQTPLQLADVYVPLDTSLRVDESQTLEQWLRTRRRPARRAALETQRGTRAVAALEALALHRESRSNC